MPIYEYKCSNCGHESEALQSMSEDALTTCEKCGEDSLEKLVSAAGFKLTGTGWYETDFKGKKKSNSESSTAKPSGSSDK